MVKVFKLNLIYYHLTIAKAYMPLLHDENKTKHQKVYTFADKRWRHHMKKAVRLLKEETEKLRVNNA